MAFSIGAPLCDWLALGPEHYWTLNGTLLDTITGSDLLVFVPGSGANADFRPGPFGSYSSLGLRDTVRYSPVNTSIGAYAATDSFSIAFWTRYTGGGAPGADHSMVSKTYIAGETRPWWTVYGYGTSAALVQMRKVSGTTYLASSPTGISADGNWHLVTAIVDQTALKTRIYLDAVAGADVTITTDAWGTNGAAALGVGFNQGQGYGGDGAHLALWRRALSAAEVAVLYAARLPCHRSGGWAAVIG